MAPSRLIAAAAATAAAAVGVAIAVFVTCKPAGDLPPPEPAATADASCAARLSAAAEPPLGPPPLFEPPGSLALVDLRVPRAFLDREVEAKVPRTLASASGKSAGAAGKVSYAVTRGPFRFSLVGEQLVARTPVTVSIEICKPLLGSLCPVYGSCSPELEVEASVPVHLDPQYRTPRPAVKVAMKRGCSVVGFDVSSRVQSIAQGNVGRIEQRIAAALPELGPTLRQGLALGSVLPLGRGRCLRVEPTSASQLPAALDDQALTLGLELGAAVATSEDCSPMEPPPAPPPLAIAPRAQSAHAIAVPSPWPWADLAEALRAAWLGRELAGGRLDAVEVRGARSAGEEGEPLMLLKLELSGARCGALWVAARPAVAGDPLTLTLSLAETLPIADEPLGRAIGQSLAAVALPLPQATRELVTALQTAPTTLAEAAADSAVTVSLAPADTRVEAIPSRDALVLLARRDARVTVTLRAQP